MRICTEKKIIQNYLCLKQKKTNSCGMWPKRRRHGTYIVQKALGWEGISSWPWLNSILGAKTDVKWCKPELYSPYWRSMLHNEIPVPTLGTQLPFEYSKKRWASKHAEELNTDTLPSSSLWFHLVINVSMTLAAEVRIINFTVNIQGFKF